MPGSTVLATAWRLLATLNLQYYFRNGCIEYLNFG